MPITVFNNWYCTVEFIRLEVLIFILFLPMAVRRKLSEVIIVSNLKQFTQFFLLYTVLNKLVKDSLHARENVKTKLNYSFVIDRRDSKISFLLVCHTANDLPVKDSEGHFSHELGACLFPRLTVV
jgi:hypothetical protein